MVFLSPQVKRGVITSNKMVYISCLTLLPNDLRLRKIGNISKILKLDRVIA